MPDWLISFGIVGLLAAIVLRIIIMMRASDAGASNLATPHGRQLLRDYRSAFPKSLLPALMRGLLALSLLALAIGLTLRLRH